MAKLPSKRDLVLGHMRVAGFEDDRKAWTRLYVENKISQATAEEAWRTGRTAATRGEPVNRDRATGQYVMTAERPCRCGHGLGEHSAARVAGAQPCFADGCDCESFKPARQP